MSIVKILRSTVSGHVPAIAVAANGSITFTTNPLANTSITLGGTSVSFVAEAPSGNEVQVQDNLPDTLASLLSFLQASADENIVKATYAVNEYVLDVTYYTESSAGNSFQIASTVAGSTTSGAYLSGGVDGVQSGRIAINEADGILFWLDADGQVDSFNLKNLTVTTPAGDDNSTKPANTEWVNAALTAAIEGVTASPPANLSTIEDLAAALNNDPNFWQTTQNSLVNRLRFDQAQTLSPTQLSQVQANIGLPAQLEPYAFASALPGYAQYNALAANNIIINGDGSISQINGSSGIACTVSSYLTDMVRTIVSTDIGAVAQQVPDAPPGYNYSMKMSITAALTTLNAGSYAVFQLPIEGWRIAKLALGFATAQPMALSFYVKAHRPGVYSASLRNSGSPGWRAYPFTFTVAAADTWQLVQVVVPGDTAASGYYNTTNGIGLYLQISMAMGANFYGTANAWQAGVYTAVAGGVNGVAATTDYMAVTGLVLLPGNQLPPAAAMPWLMRPADEELQLCERYLECSYYSIGSAGGGDMWLLYFGVNIYLYRWPFRRLKRVTPAFGAYNGSWNNGTPSIYASISEMTFENTQDTQLSNQGLSPGAIVLSAVADARM